jgi:hypothetical protein
VKAEWEGNPNFHIIVAQTPIGLRFSMSRPVLTIGNVKENCSVFLTIG